jgi:hypothetical protein
MLMNTNWQDKYPMVSVHALECIKRLPDHAPIFLTFGTPRQPCKRPFKFELEWLQREDFDDMVNNIWERLVAGITSILRWNTNMRAMRKHLSEWASHVAGILKTKNFAYHLLLIIWRLWMRPLSAQEIELKSQSNAQIAGLLCEEEVKWYRRSIALFILEGDSNTRCFHGVANGRHRKNRIHSLV